MIVGNLLYCPVPCDCRQLAMSCRSLWSMYAGWVRCTRADMYALSNEQDSFFQSAWSFFDLSQSVWWFYAIQSRWNKTELLSQVSSLEGRWWGAGIVLWTSWVCLIVVLFVSTGHDVSHQRRLLWKRREKHEQPARDLWRDQKPDQVVMTLNNRHLISDDVANKLGRTINQWLEAIQHR